ncbi:Hypothetical protein FKW44_010609 [Caligus rogercresseyi]|uniref:Uncharacterized protein n=1 Tax=Caligus rogercresseyi TaxID=217165 RepID=A0A7T8HHV1_CALRO|nr:Hypothetical protein FKW44_010609 [Caligus rogercresseyi]
MWTFFSLVGGALSTNPFVLLHEEAFGESIMAMGPLKKKLHSIFNNDKVWGNF